MISAMLCNYIASNAETHATSNAEAHTTSNAEARTIIVTYRPLRIASPVVNERPVHLSENRPSVLHENIYIRERLIWAFISVEGVVISLKPLTHVVESVKQNACCFVVQ